MHRQTQSLLRLPDLLFLTSVLSISIVVLPVLEELVPQQRREKRKILNVRSDETRDQDKTRSDRTICIPRRLLWLPKVPSCVEDETKKLKTKQRNNVLKYAEAILYYPRRRSPRIIALLQSQLKDQFTNSSLTQMLILRCVFA